MTYLEDARRKALHQVETWIADSFTAVERMTHDQLAALGRSGEWDGWHLPLPSKQGGELLLMLDADFPYSLPRIAIGGRSDLLKDPHVELKGLLCLAGDAARADTLDPRSVVEYCYREALSLIAGNEAGENRDDFLTDFNAYWRRDSTSDFRVRTWLNPREQSRLVAAWHGKEFYLVAETAHECSSWLTNRYGADERTFHTAAVIWLETLPEPSKFPDNGADIFRLVRSQSVDGMAIFDALMRQTKGHSCLVLSGRTVSGEVAQATTVIDDHKIVDGKSPAPSKPINRGFRPGKTPANVLAFRRASRRTQLDRVNAWHSRVRDGEPDELSRKSAAVIGCGSLGAGVAKLLLQSGVGQLLLIDPDDFSFVNVGRHELGADSVGKKKATTLRDKFRLMYPHAHRLEGYASTWQRAISRDPSIFRNCDLVLSLIGDWNSESALNDVQRSAGSGISSPIVYGWLEEQAGAAHALAIGSVGPCFRCGFSQTGTSYSPATKWTKLGVVACGAPTSVYGAVELGPAQSLVASLAIDLLLERAVPPVRRTWLAPSSVLDHGGGYWHPAWVEKFGDPGHGGVLTATAWPEKPSCPCR